MAAAALEDFQQAYTESSRFLVGLMADYETTIGFVLAGIGEFLDHNKKYRNFMMVDEDSDREKVETYFRYLCDSSRIGVILIGTEVYQSLYELIKVRRKPVPIIIEIPSRRSLEFKKEKYDD